MKTRQARVGFSSKLRLSIPMVRAFKDKDIEELIQELHRYGVFGIKTSHTPRVLVDSYGLK